MSGKNTHDNSESSDIGDLSDEESASKGKWRLKRLIIVGVIVLLIIAIPGILYFTGALSRFTSAKKDSTAIAEEHQPQEDAKEGGGHGEEGHGEAKESAHGEAKEEGHGEAKEAAHGEAKEGGHGEGGHGEGKEAKKNTPVFYEMDEFLVNLSSPGRQPSFLKMTVSLDLPGADAVPEIEAKLPRIRDSFQVYLRELRAEDLQGSAGIYRLREELLLRINKVVYPVKVNDILFKEILVQ